MAAIARILQFIGWVWVIAGFLLPAFGIARPNIFPGFILIFVARALRTQASRRAPRDEEVEEPIETQRVLHPRSERPQPTPKPVLTAPPEPPREVIEPPRVEPVLDSEPEERDDIIERIAIAGRVAGGTNADQGRPGVTPPEEREERKAPMTSAEMIAQARKRWDSKS